MKYSDLLADTLVEQGYTTVFFVSGGNIMHLIESFSHKFVMIPVIHEVSAVIACDYFNEASSGELKSSKACALVTLGPGVSNTTTGIACAYLDSREVLLIGGQVKSIDLKAPTDRQNGLQELDGVKLLNSITKRAVRIVEPIPMADIKQIIASSWSGRKGPVYLEICLDAQGRELDIAELNSLDGMSCDSTIVVKDYDELGEQILNLLGGANRPLILAGGGLPRKFKNLLSEMAHLSNIPVATSWNGADRFDANCELYAGRPNMFGQRWANIFIQQADLILIVGSSLGIQQTGFNISEFARKATLIQLDIDSASLENTALKTHIKVEVDLGSFFPDLHEKAKQYDWSLKSSERIHWLDFKRELRQGLPLAEAATNLEGHNNPFQIINDLSKIAPRDLTVVSCSSGGTYTSFMQTFENRGNQLVISSKGLGSMGIGLAGAIGAAKATPNPVWLFEGDGGFAQNLQELGTVKVNNLNLKIIIFSNHGYASIRSTQKRYFNGNYVGCDIETGLGLPELKKISEAFNIDYFPVYEGDFNIEILKETLLMPGPQIIEVFLSVEQAYLPKIDSRLAMDGSMESNPLHIMNPDLSDEQKARFFKYI